MSSCTKALFVCGTDTDVGKTIASAWLALHWQADYWKPIQSGLDQGSDSQRVAQLAQAHCYPENWRLQAPLSPHQAAANEGVSIDIHNCSLPNAERLIVEGAGGVLTPLNEHQRIVDLISHFNIPVLLVARSGLGTINHTCLTIEALRTRQLNLLGVLMVGASNAANRSAIEHYGQTTVLAEIPWFDDLSHQQLTTLPFPSALDSALATLAT